MRSIEDQRQSARLRLREQLRQQELVIEANPVWVNCRSANVRNGPSETNRVLERLEKGERVFVQDSLPQWLLVKYDNPQFRTRKYSSAASFDRSYAAGWIHRSLVSSIEIAKKKSPWEIAASMGILKIGMPSKFVRLSWGSPDEVNKTVTAWGVSEQWVYSTGHGKHRFAYIDDGRLTSWQE